MDQLRQGDVFLQPVESIPEGCEPLADMDASGNPVLAFGEKTGHNHVVVAEPGTKIRWIGQKESDGSLTRYLEASGPFAVVHTTQHGEPPDHAPLVQAPGMYEVRIQREQYSPREIRNVVD